MIEKYYTIKNVGDYAVRFSPILQFLPGETVTVSESTMKKIPAIGILIERGIFKNVTKKHAPKTDEELVEEA